MQVTTMVVGALGIVMGLGLLWVIVALVVGNLVGSVFMAAHSAQGPHLGIPQMIQSRAQFGVRGAAIPLAAVVVAYVMFFAANAVMMRDAVQRLVPVGDNVALALFGLVTFVVAFLGYELIHRLGTVMTWVSGLLFATVAVIVLASGNADVVGPTIAGPTAFSFPIFLLVCTQALSWSLGFGPFVADYSRYLPPDVPTRATFWISYLGQALGSTLVMVVGAIVATAAVDIAASPALAVADLFGWFATPALLLCLLGVVLFNVLCLYSGYMSTVTTFSGFRGMSVIPLRTKFVIMGCIAVLGTAVAIAAQEDFFAFFGDILIAQVYFLVPWTAINLVDFYVVRKGEYAIEDIFDPDGRYGRYNGATITIFVVSVLAQLPFMSLTVYQGPLAAWLGVDISYVIGLVVPIVLYTAMSRSRTSPRSPAAR
jgi:nucleobase:cation symporter-1, NCS1 family